MERVQSKHLFESPKYRLNGVVDQDVLEDEKQMMAKFMGDPAFKQMYANIDELETNWDDDKAKEYLAAMRDFVDVHMGKMVEHPVFQKGISELDTEQFKVPTTHDGDFGVPVFKYTPKKMQGSKNNAAMIYAHGGGCVASTADASKPYLAPCIVDWNLICFNVDYRLAPETKCPNNAKDFYESIKYICANAESMGVDPARICISGHSGGGYVCLAAMVLLAQNDEGHLIKLATPGIPMVDDYHFSDPGPFTAEEKQNHKGMRMTWRFIATDLETQKDDPLLFPGKASDELLAKFPPTIMESAEFDMFRTETCRLAARLLRAGRLLEFLTVPGAKHASGMQPDFDCFKKGKEMQKLAMDAYL